MFTTESEPGGTLRQHQLYHHPVPLLNNQYCFATRLNVGALMCVNLSQVGSSHSLNTNGEKHF